MRTSYDKRVTTIKDTNKMHDKLLTKNVKQLVKFPL